MTKNSIAHERERKIARIRAFKNLGWSIRAYAKAAGVSQGGNIRHMDKPDWSPSDTLIKKLESAIPAGVQLDEEK